MNTEKKEPVAYMWDFEGAYDPGNGKSISFYSETFSVGIFQWVPKASGKGLKRSAVVKRIRGRVSNPKEVYTRARTICDGLNSGEIKEL